MPVGMEPGGKVVANVPVGKAVSLKTMSDKGIAVGFWLIRETENVGGRVPAVSVPLMTSVGLGVAVGGGD